MTTSVLGILGAFWRRKVIRHGNSMATPGQVRSLGKSARLIRMLCYFTHSLYISGPEVQN
jgi:hypothetical protein